MKTWKAFLAGTCATGVLVAACSDTNPGGNLFTSSGGGAGSGASGTVNPGQSPYGSDVEPTAMADGSVIVPKDASPSGGADATVDASVEASGDSGHDAGHDAGPHKPTSCKDLLANVPSSPDGVYMLDPDGPSGAPPFVAYCDMTNDGGGWTLALKADGTQSTFTYDATIWTDTSVLHTDQPYFDTNEAKLQTWNSVPFDDMRVGMTDPRDSTTRYVKVNLPGTASLSALFALGTPPTTSLGRASWEGLLSVGSLQNQCNMEGVNVDPSGGVLARVRIGFLGNQESECGTADSWIGIGGSYPIYDCNSVTNPSVGNSAPPICGPYDHGSQQIAAFGYVFVR